MTRSGFLKTIFGSLGAVILAPFVKSQSNMDVIKASAAPLRMPKCRNHPGMSDLIYHKNAQVGASCDLCRTPLEGVEVTDVYFGKARIIRRYQTGRSRWITYTAFGADTQCQVKADEWIEIREFDGKQTHHFSLVIDTNESQQLIGSGLNA